MHRLRLTFVITFTVAALGGPVFVIVILLKLHLYTLHLPLCCAMYTYFEMVIPAARILCRCVGTLASHRKVIFMTYATHCAALQQVEVSFI